MGAHENEASFDASASESGTVVNHEEGKPVKKSKLLLAVLYFGMLHEASFSPDLGQL
jgi:hypothetical protein